MSPPDPLPARPTRHRRQARALAPAVALAVLVGASACSSSEGGGAAPSSTSSGAATTASAAGEATAAPTTSSTGAGALPDDFYMAPSPLPDGGPGTIIRSRPIPSPGGARGWAILYGSTAADGSPTAVSGVVYVPDAPAPAGAPRDVLAWAHGTTGLGDACASSRQFATQTAAELAIVSFATGQGFVFVATDYQGLGTPGPHPYLVNTVEGRNVLDSVRAAQLLPEAGTSAASRSIVWGHSQGGGAAALAAELQPAYAPELALKGSVVGAPAADLAGLAGAATAAGTATGFGFAVMALTGFAAAYPDVSLDRLLTDEGRTVAAAIVEQCNDEIQASLAATPANALFRPGVATDAALAARLQENSAGYIATTVPILVYHGDADEVVPVGSSKTVLDRWCALGVTATRTVYPGADHISVILAAAGDIAAWVQARLAGQPAAATC